MTEEVKASLGQLAGAVVKIATRYLRYRKKPTRK